MAARIEYKASVARDLRELGQAAAVRVVRKVERMLASEGHRGKALSGEFAGLYKLRVGNYRVIYARTEEGYLVLRIGHRQESIEEDVLRSTNEPFVSGGGVTTADRVLRQLKEGNRRFVAGEMIHPDQTADRRAEVAKGQKPFAIVFGCVDSRVPPELVFDRGLGDLLVIRTAGHALDSASLNSVEFGVYQLGIPLIMVLGHQKCAAVAATIEVVEKGAMLHGHIGALVQAIKPAVQKVKGQSGDMLDNAVKANVELTVGRLGASKILAGFIERGKVRIVGGRYDLNTGVVDTIVS